MCTGEQRNDLDKIIGEIVVAFLNKNSVSSEELPILVKRLRQSFINESIYDNLEFENQNSEIDVVENRSPMSSSNFEPAVPIEDSIHDEYLVSLEDGRRFRSLRRHLMAKYGMKPEDYRKKWRLPDDYPMVAPSYAKERSEVAKRTGLGKGKGKSGRENSRSHG